MNTTDTNMPRRHFLAAGAVLAAGGLLLPSGHSARAATVAPATDAELWAIIDRPIHRSAVPICRCHDCDTIRAAPFTCPACGFQGEPVVCPCDCGHDWDDWTAVNAAILQRRRLSKKDLADIGAFQARLMARGRPGLCDVRDPMCAHGGTICPVCGDSGSDDPFEGEDEPRAVAAMLRDLRAALRTRAGT